MIRYSLHLSYLELSQTAWHALCNRGCRQPKTFESKVCASGITPENRIMKPTPQNLALRSRSGRLAMPKTDCAFRSNSADDFGPRGGKVRYRDLSGGYFKYEAPRAFATEAALFGVILLTVIVPLINSASAVMHMVRAFSL